MDSAHDTIIDYELHHADAEGQDPYVFHRLSEAGCLRYGGAPDGATICCLDKDGDVEVVAAAQERAVLVVLRDGDDELWMMRDWPPSMPLMTYCAAVRKICKRLVAANDQNQDDTLDDALAGFTVVRAGS